MRESASRMYSLLPYYFTKTATEIPLYFIGPMVTLNIVYWGVGFYHNIYEFFEFYLVLFLLGQCAQSMGLMVSSIFSNSDAAQ